MYLVKTPPLVKVLLSDYVWTIPTKDREVFITFDDGPIPDLTPWVLDQLALFGFKATFFCVGDNVRKNPDIFERILQEGHMVGNHTFHHLNGWHTENEAYLKDVAMCDELHNTPLFRPPYGKIRPGQSMALKHHKNIVMWDVLSGDFDNNISSEKCLSNVMDNYAPGSIIVFHDNIKAKEKLKFTLPVFLKHLSDNDFVSSNLECLVDAYAEA
jgi:peptidoglycan/xylan/chitin deacetylase (PgdA/CDA1 family)